MTTTENMKRARELYNLFNEIERNDGDWSNGKKDLAEVMASLLTRFVNGSIDKKAFTEAFSLEHRTLQQGVVSLFLGLLKDITTWEDYKFDGRNEVMRSTAFKIMDTLGYSGLPLV